MALIFNPTILYLQHMNSDIFSFFFYLPHNSIVIFSAEKQDMKFLPSLFHVSVVLYWFHSVLLYYYWLAGWTVHHVRDQSVARFSFVFILSEHNHPRTTEAQLLLSHRIFAILCKKKNAFVLNISPQCPKH